MTENQSGDLMKQITLTTALTLLWLTIAIVVQPQTSSHAPLVVNAASTAALPYTVSSTGTISIDRAVPQIRVWPLDGSLISLDGQAPLQSQGISFVAGRFDRAAEFSRAVHSHVTYRAAGNVDPKEGSLTMWIRPTFYLTDTAYRDHPQLFSYAIDPDNQLYLEVGEGCVTLSQRNQGRLFPGTCLQAAGWRAGEWHHLAVTWSASANHLAVYYDCTLSSTGGFNALNGTAATFQLGSDVAGRSIEATLDDVRLSRRALTADEIAAICRDRPLSRAKTYELATPLEAAPLGALQPITGLLPSGTVSFTLSLTTTAAATCRWSEIAATPYVSMPHMFQVGEGTVSHSTPITGVAALDDRHFYARCQDLAAGRDPDGFEQQTHVRVLGPASDRYPRTANLWNDFSSNPGTDFVAGFDLQVVFGGLNQANQAPTIRAANPSAKILLTAQARALIRCWPGWFPRQHKAAP